MDLASVSLLVALAIAGLLAACAVLSSLVSFRLGKILGKLEDRDFARSIVAELREAGEADAPTSSRLDA